MSNKITSAVAFLALFLAIALGTQKAWTSLGDLIATGDSTNMFRIDQYGGIIQTDHASAANSLVDSTVTGTLAVTGNMSVGGSLTGTQTISGNQVFTPYAVQSIYYGTGTITASARYVQVGSSASFNMNAVNGPCISTVGVTTGQLLTIISTGATLGIPTDVTLNTARVYSSTRGAFVSISSVTPRSFIFDGTAWCQQ